MTTVRARPPRRRRSDRRPLARAALLLLAALLLFALGVGLGRALEENEPTRGMRTEVRTLNPLPLSPVEQTVTVTVTR